MELKVESLCFCCTSDHSRFGCVDLSVNRIQDQPAFAWWIPYVIKKRSRIINRVRPKYWERTHKYGLEVPKQIEDAKRIDAENGDTQWQDSISKEMTNVMIAFEECEGNPLDLISYQEITGHLVFDIKLGENF